MSAKQTLVQLILNATTAGKAMLTAANAAAQKTLLSLQNVDNTADTAKPVSTAQATANGLRVLKAGDTMTGQLINSTNGAASTPPVLVSGTWFTGGTATTTKPQSLVEPSGTTSTGWSTSGTGVGVNAATGFGGNLIDLQVAGSSKFKVSSAGGITVPSGGGTGEISDSAGSNFRLSNVGLCFGTSQYFACSNGNTNVPDVTQTRSSAGVWRMGTNGANALGSLLLTNLTASGLICAGTYTAATLPSASANAYKFATVSDSSVTTFGSTVAGGGSGKVQVFSNGSNWTVCAA